MCMSFPPTRTSDDCLLFSQAQGPNEVTVSAHQIVQLIHRSAHSSDPSHGDQTTPSPAPDPDTHHSSLSNNPSLPWALVRFVVAGTASTPNAPVDEGYIPSRLLGAPVYPRAASVSTSGASGGRRSMRRWLPSSSSSGASGGKDRRQILPSTAAKRSSKADLPAVDVGFSQLP